MNTHPATHGKIDPLLNWLLSRGPQERDTVDLADRLEVGIRTIAECKYNAAARLRQQAGLTFVTTTALALGLIFIPLMHNSGIALAFSANVLNMMQIFLAVWVLVFAVVIGTSRYDVRAMRLSECGDKLRDLASEIDKERESSVDGKIQLHYLNEFQRRFSEIVGEVENHSRNDARFATLELRADYPIRGIPRLIGYLEAQFIRALGFSLPVLLVVMEAGFVTDMTGATNIFSDYLTGRAVGERLSAQKTPEPAPELKPSEFKHQ